MGSNLTRRPFLVFFFCLWDEQKISSRVWGQTDMRMSPVFIAVCICILFEEAAQEIKWCQTHAATRVDSDGRSHIQCTPSQFSEMEGAKETSDYSGMMSQPCPQERLFIYCDPSFQLSSSYSQFTVPNPCNVSYPA